MCGDRKCELEHSGGRRHLGGRAEDQGTLKCFSDQIDDLTIQRGDALEGLGHHRRKKDRDWSGRVQIFWTRALIWLRRLKHPSKHARRM